MNNKQKEICDLIVEIFKDLEFGKNLSHKIIRKFNVLSSDDSEWSIIEDHVFGIIKQLEKIHE